PVPSEAAAPRAAPAAAAVSAPRREAAPSAEPAADAAPQSDPHLALEVLPYVKLRSGGQTRRFQIQARLSPRAAQCDPAVLDLLIVQRVVGWLAAHRTVWNSQPTSFSINLSIATLEDERFAHKVSAELNAHGIHCAAKRVETQAAAQWLGATGCYLAQGAALSGTKSRETLLTSPDATGLTTHANRQKLFNDQ